MHCSKVVHSAHSLRLPFAGACQPPVSLISLLFPSVDANGDLTYDGYGELIQDKDEALRQFYEDEVEYFTDTSFYTSQGS